MLVFAVGMTAGVAGAQTRATSVAPAAPKPQTPSLKTAVPPAPAAPAAAEPLPAANPEFFTAKTPTVDTVNSFLHEMWGFDTNREWRVMAIQSTPAPNVSQVIIFVREKVPGAKIQASTFFTTPDGQHAIGEGAGVIPFGAHPFAPTRELLKEQANGASVGPASKDFELVEFADLQCPHCKEAQPIMQKIEHDFPKAHVVFQLFPIVTIHPSAFKAASYGICAQQVSNDAFFKFADGVFDTQEGLTPATEDTILKAAAKRAGLDADKIAACAATEATKDAVNADIKLAKEAGVNQTPLLSVNGRMLPLVSAMPYEEIKKIIQYQATLDGVDSGATPETLAPEKPAPKLQDLPK